VAKAGNGAGTKPATLNNKGERVMAPITTIVHFEVPAGNVDRFFAFWQDSVKDKVNKQPGLIDGIF
jgi:hypothetical protein